MLTEVSMFIEAHLRFSIYSVVVKDLNSEVKSLPFAVFDCQCACRCKLTYRLTNVGRFNEIAFSLEAAAICCAQGEICWRGERHSPLSFL